MTFTNITKQRADDGSLYRCPCCNCRTLTERGCEELCPVCFWQDDGQDNHDADEVRGGPNYELGLTQARKNYQEFGASNRRRLQHVRKPKPEEL
jgi:Cysteine-rich CPCC